MENVRSLADVSYDAIYQAYHEAFAEYEVLLSKDQFWVMINRRGYNPSLSFGAFDGDRLVAFTLNGIGYFDGKKTAYDTGTGTLKEYRGRGLAARVFNESLPHLKNAGVEQYLLEVLQHNPSAISVYKNVGFAATRELSYFKTDAANLTSLRPLLPLGLFFERVDLSSTPDMETLWDFTPSWQNSFDSVKRQLNDFRFIGVYDCKRLVGYGIFEPYTGDITQIAVEPSYRRRGVGSAILAKLLEENRCNEVKAINVEPKSIATEAFLVAVGIPQIGKQFEMIKLI
jgi:ribosomal protein S18 acetylase RimI-like enzyme